MQNIFRLFFYIFFLTTVTCFSAGFKDIKVIQSNKNETVYEYTVQNFSLNEVLKENDISYVKPVFDNAVFPETENSYRLPSRALQFIIPENGDVTVEIISKSQKQLYFL